MTDTALPRPASPLDLFVSFTWLALQGFGGVLAVSQRVLCENKRWLTKEQFLEMLAIGQVLPGPNICNVALMIGDRFFGWRGAFAALGGMMAVPLLIVMALAVLYVEFAANPLVAGALRGMGAVAAGLIAGTALKLAPALRGNPMGAATCVAFAAATFVLVALMRVPLVWVLLGLGALACTVAWLRVRNDPVRKSSTPRRRAMTLAPELPVWLTLLGHFLVLSLLCVGGAISMAPEMHRLMVGQLNLLTDTQFNASIAIAQAAPGPNVLFVAVMGYQAAGWKGAAATLLGIMLPSTTLAYAAARWGHARAHWRGVRAFKAGMAPITIALLLVTGWILSVDTPGVAHFAVTALAAILVWRTRVHMLWMILAGAVAGALGWV